MAETQIIKSIPVVHEKFGEGQTLEGRHSPITESGDVEWFDVLFEHGVERVPSAELKETTTVTEAANVGDKVMDARGRVGIIRLGLNNRLVVDYGNGETDIHSPRYWKPIRESAEPVTGGATPEPPPIKEGKVTVGTFARVDRDLRAESVALRILTQGKDLIGEAEAKERRSRRG